MESVNMHIDKTITNSRSDLLIGFNSHLKQDDRKWLRENGYRIERFDTNGLMYKIDLLKKQHTLNKYGN